MKLSAYVVAVDTGFAPNPFGKCLTLACCKPVIRRCALKGDIIVGVGSAKCGVAGKLIYAMKVSRCVPMEAYWDLYPSKRPNPKTAIGRCGDNVWRKTKAGDWVFKGDAYHDLRHKDYDTGGEQVLVATEFYYFGSSALEVPKEYLPMLTVGRGHRNTLDEKLIKRFWLWLGNKAGGKGRIGMPCAFEGGGCRLHCDDPENDDDDWRQGAENQS